MCASSTSLYAYFSCATTGNDVASETLQQLLPTTVKSSSSETPDRMIFQSKVGGAMTSAHHSEIESFTPQENLAIQANSFATSSLGDIRFLNQATDVKPGALPSARIGEQGELLFCGTPVKDAKEPVKESKETPEQRTDQKIKDTFGADVFEHLKDWDWLIANRKKLEDGFKKAKNDDGWDMAWRMHELSKVGDKSVIYLSKEDGPTKGNLIPKRHNIYLRREVWSDNELGHVYPKK